MPGSRNRENTWTYQDHTHTHHFFGTVHISNGSWVIGNSWNPLFLVLNMLGIIWIHLVSLRIKRYQKDSPGPFYVQNDMAPIGMRSSEGTFRRYHVQSTSVASPREISDSNCPAQAAADMSKATVFPPAYLRQQSAGSLRFTNASNASDKGGTKKCASLQSISSPTHGKNQPFGVEPPLDLKLTTGSTRSARKLSI